MDPADQRCSSLICTSAVSGALAGKSRCGSILDDKAVKPWRSRNLRSSLLSIHFLAPPPPPSHINLSWSICNEARGDWIGRLLRNLLEQENAETACQSTSDVRLRCEYAHGYQMQLVGFFDRFQFISLLNISGSRIWAFISLIVWRKMEHLVAAVS